MGIERVILALKQQGIAPPPLPAPVIQVSPLGQAAVIPSLQLVRDLRLAGIGALLAFGGRSLKAQLKAADKAGVAYTLIRGDAELAAGVVIARDMANSEQTDVATGDVIEWLKARS